MNQSTPIVGFCPHCRARIELATDVVGTGAVPKDGDIGVCVECAEVHAFTNDRGIRAVTDADMVRATPATAALILKIQTIVRERLAVRARNQ